MATTLFGRMLTVHKNYVLPHHRGAWVDSLTPRNHAQRDASLFHPPAFAKAQMSQSEVERRKQVIASGKTDFDRWSDSRQLEAAWEARAKYASNFIPAGIAILDIGCGAMKLECYLPYGTHYVPADVVRRDDRTVVLDLNEGPLPASHLAAADLIVMLGVWEYLYRPEVVLAAFAAGGKPILCSYCPTDAGVPLDRRALGWVNDYTLSEFTGLAERNGYQVALSRRVDDVQYLFKLTPGGRKSPSMSPKQVHVISYNSVGNFGDRLGFHLLNEVLPPHAEVSWGQLRPFGPVPKDVDLLVIGIGNSLFGEVIGEPLIAAAKSAKASIGIFGTQYRELLPRQQLDPLLDHLTHWYARYEDDIRLYGRGRTNVSHLGDWLINAFPMARATDDRLLTVGEEIWQQLPLDRVIQQIQAHKKVFSERLHPLLCALTSAEQVGYKEQPYSGSPNILSGKFRSMLIDIFGQTFPENSFWNVDREKVGTYKHHVREKTEQLRRHLAQLLQS